MYKNQCITCSFQTLQNHSVGVIGPVLEILVSNGSQKMKISAGNLCRALTGKQGHS